MDITLFLDNDTNEKISSMMAMPVSNRKILLKSYLDKLNNYSSKDIINLREHTFMIEYVKKDGSIVCVQYFVEIVNKIVTVTKDYEFINLCKGLFSKILNPSDEGIIEKKLIFDPEYVIEKILKNPDNAITFTDDQSQAIRSVITFLADKTKRIFGLYGYAGTGKTTTMVELISFLLKNSYIKSNGLTAPTNKAVNIMKSKMRFNLKDICSIVNGKIYEPNTNIDVIINALEDHNIKTDFMTIHRLLNYKNDFNIDGERIFLKLGVTLMDNYDLIIVDECSMISLQIIIHLFEDIRNSNKKVIFCGDNIQLPPVNEKKSTIFIKEKSQLDYEFFSRTIDELQKNSSNSKGKLNNFLTTKKRYELITSEIINMEYYILKEVMRNKIGNVVNLCYHIREWVDNIVKIPDLNKFKGQGVFMYQYDKKIDKTQTTWYKKFVDYQQGKNKNKAQDNISNIILTWTNEQTNRYNNEIRRIMFKKTKDQTLSRYEIGDILMLGDFYNFEESCVKNKFYTSEQIKVMDKEELLSLVSKIDNDFSEIASKKLLKTKNADLLLNRYKNIVKLLNAKTTRKYQIYKLSVQRLTEALVKDSIPEIYAIHVIHENSQNQLECDKNVSTQLIKKFRQDMLNEYKDQIKLIDSEIIRPLWRQWNKIFINQFANVNYGNSHSVHKSQGSSFYNVFVDTDDILNNPNEDEAKRCIYTAFTRSSNELHILL